MVLFTLAGLAARTWLGFEPGLMLGLLAGFVVASVIPTKTSCRVAPRPPEAEDTAERP